MKNAMTWFRGILNHERRIQELELRSKLDRDAIKALFAANENALNLIRELIDTTETHDRQLATANANMNEVVASSDKCLDILITFAKSQGITTSLKKDGINE